MYVINSDKNTGTIFIHGTYSNSEAPVFSNIGDTHVVSIMGIEDVLKFKSFSFTASGIIETRYLDTYYRISRNNSTSWTEWLSLDTNISNFPPFDPKDKLNIDIKWERSGYSTIGHISLYDYFLYGTIYRKLYDGESSINLNNTLKEVLIKPPYVYKVFKITDIEILSVGDISNLSIKYRFSQDYGRTVTNWEELTKENITTVRINPIRFFQIEYLLEYSGSTQVTILDINLIGDFQNVTLDSKKTNVYGSRENCNCLQLGFVSDPDTLPPEANVNDLLMVSNCDPNVNKPMTPDDIAKLFKPYQQTQAIDLLNKLSSDANEVFGHEVVYFITDPDKKGIDYTFHEYQLYNYVCSDLVKVSVDGNNFPDNQIVMNQFDLSLFDSFEIHIPKETFKKTFGVEKRPSKEDFLWFCEINRMFQVEHAQQFRNFNNSALYWKVILKKYVQKSNIIGANQNITDKVKELTKNSTIEELFGIENKLDKKDVSNEEQFRPLTKDKLRLEINVDIDKELIENSSTIISKTNYDLSMAEYQSVAVMYRNFRHLFKVSDNFSFFIWFNIKNYTVNDIYNLIKYYDDSNLLGFSINIEADNIIVKLNSNEYRFNIGTQGNADALIEDTWYCYLVNFDQRQRKISQWVYKRNVDVESDAPLLGHTFLRKIYFQEDVLSPVEFEIENNNMLITASDMKVTNIRLFNDIIPETEHNKILNQIIIGQDYRNLIISDNANSRLVLPNYPISQIDTPISRGEINKDLD